MKLVNTAMVAASAGGSSPTVFALVLDDLLTRHYPNYGQNCKLTAPAGTTGTVSFDDGATIYSASTLATSMQSELEALTGYSGKVTVSGASTEAGDKYTFTITFDGSLGAVTLAFHASSQWYPVITLTESVTSVGTPDEVFSMLLTPSYDFGGASATLTPTSGDSFLVSISEGDDPTATAAIQSAFDTYHSGQFSVSASGGGFLVTAITGGAHATYTWSSSNEGVGGIVISSQVNGVSGQSEVHEITTAPISPTGGTWKPSGAGAAIAHNADTAAIDTQIEAVLGGGSVAVGISGSSGIADGTVTVTWAAVGDQTDTALSPVSVSLTAPEITHSIT